MKQAKVFAMMVLLAVFVTVFVWVATVWPAWVYAFFLGVLLLKLFHIVATIIVEKWERKS